jgi:type II secretory pathway component PulF
MFARLGEQTGQLPVMLQRAATQRVEGLGSRRHTLRHLFAKTVKNLL